jgi:hypothetical protein
LEKNANVIKKEGRGKERITDNYKKKKKGAKK